MNATELMESLRHRGIALSEVEGKLAVRPATALTPDDRAAIRSHLPELVATLADQQKSVLLSEPVPNDSWDEQTARQLMFDADTLVGELGVDGRHPAVLDAAAMVFSAHATHDLETVRFAVSEFVVVVRGLAAKKFAFNKPATRPS